jgi:virginiamycin B lyase
MWFTEPGFNAIGRMTAAGDVTTFTGIRQPYRIIAGPDGALWFTSRINNIIGRITTDGRVSLFHVAHAGRVLDIVSGPGNALWFTAGRTIGRITTDGRITQFDDPYGTPGSITAGPDGALWFTTGIDSIGRMTQHGVFTNVFTNLQLYFVNQITTGPDGALWFSYLGDIVGRMTTHGEVTRFSVPRGAGLGDIMPGPDGALWFGGGSWLGRITTAGVVTTYEGVRDPFAITIGPDHESIWFACGNDAIGRLPLPATAVAPS